MNDPGSRDLVGAARPADYNRRAVEEGDRQRRILCTVGCFDRSVRAFIDDKPDPGCTCGGMQRLAERHAEARRRDGVLAEDGLR